MANIKITDLTAYTDAASTDVLPVVDIGNNVTKKISIANLLKTAPAGTAGAPGIAIDGDPDTGIFSPGANQLGLVTYGTGRLFIDSIGNVGVGTASPTVPLDVVGQIRATDSTVDIRLLPLNAGSVGIVGTISDHPLSLFTNNAERCRLDSSGRLLVGTSTARTNFLNTNFLSAAFQVEGTGHNTSAISVVRNENDIYGPYVNIAKTRGAANNQNTLVQNNDVLGAIAFQGADGSDLVESATIAAAVDGTPGANDMPGRLIFGTTADGASGPTERMRIGQTGYTKISNTGSYINTAATYHEIVGDAGSSSLALTIANTSATGNGVQINSNSDGTSYLYLIGYSTSASAIRIIIWSNGNVVNLNNSYGAISDIKLKENIVDATSQWDDIKALQVRKYNFKEGQTHTQIGLVAQEVELVSPGLVSESPDRDAEGNDLGTVTKSVNYSVLYMKAVKALQEAMERIETLEAKVAALEGA